MRKKRVEEQLPGYDKGPLTRFAKSRGRIRIGTYLEDVGAFYVPRKYHNKPVNVTTIQWVVSCAGVSAPLCVRVCVCF